MYFSDLSRQGGWLPGVDVQTVGWLDPTEAYPRGSVDARFVMKLVEVLVSPWQPCLPARRHYCGFCRLTGGPGTIALLDNIVVIGSSNLYVPSHKSVYAAPSTILHYVDAHEYVPPEEFRDAVLACPAMRSLDYYRALLRHGLKVKDLT